MKKNGRKEITQKTVLDRLTLLSKQADLDNPEQVKELIAKLQWKNSTKRTATLDYAGYCNYRQLKWTKPTYHPEEYIYFIPTETEIDQLIAASNPTLAALLQLLKETGARSGEATKITWTDIDLEHKTATINHPEKRSLPRILPISEKLKNMLQTLPKTDKPIFLHSTTLHGLRVTFEAMRKRTAKKLGNPRLLKIHFHTLRHWKGTMTYHDTHDAYLARQILGHKTAEMTDRYINIEKGMWMNDDGQWTCKVAQDQNEEIQLNEKGFQYVRTLTDGKPLYRKRK